MFRILRLAVLTPALLALVAATGAGSVALDSFLRTDPYTLVTGSDYESWCEEGDPAYVEDASLRGPHFALGLECLFQADEMPEAQAALSDELDSMPPAAPGTEFLFAIVAGQAPFAPEYGQDLALTAAWIEAGEERFSLNDPVGNDFIVLSVPEDERALLWVEDEGVPQAIDLRTGERFNEVGAYYNGISFGERTLDGYEYEDVQFNGDREWWRMDCGQGEAWARRAVWSRDHGWAAEGSVLVEVEFWWCGSVYDQTEWTLDTSEALRLRSDNEWYDAVRHVESFDSDSPGWELHTYIFKVPAETDEYTAFFSPIGSVTEKATGEVFTLDKDPDYTHWTMTY